MMDNKHYHCHASGLLCFFPRNRYSILTQCSRCAVLREGDEVIGAAILEEKSDVLIVTSKVMVSGHQLLVSLFVIVEEKVKQLI